MTLNNLPLVSVLMTVYNRAAFISEAIESVIASTYDNWELIIVDDQSTDNSLEISKRYESQDKRISVYLNDNNLGDYLNRNKAASYAKGKYLKYVDADDMIYPHGIELLVYYMEQFPEAGYGLCSLDQDEKSIFPLKLSPIEAYERHYIQNKSLFYKAPLSSIIRREIFNNVGGFSGKQHLGDFEMWLTLSFKYDVVLMPKGIAWYRVHDDQQMNDNRTDPYVPFKYILLEQEILARQSCPLIEKDKKVVLKNNRIKQSKAILSSLKNNSYKDFRKLHKASTMPLIDVLFNLFK